MKNLFRITDLTKDEILKILFYAKEFKDGKKYKYCNDDKVFVCNMFLEPSTRTKFSFEVAEKKLGFEVLNFEGNSSSILKGESLYDTVKTFESIGANLIVIRHSQNEYFKELSNINIPIINGGDGSGNHPTQCLLDLFTILDEFNSINSLKIGIFGDLYHSRVARSNAEALHNFSNELFFICPKEFYDESYNEYGTIVSDIDSIISELDVVMLLRVQNERHSNKISINDYLNEFGLTQKRYELLKDKAIIMHPAPVNRNVEIHSDLVECNKSRIFTQMENGVYVRMGIMKFLLEEN